MAKPKPSAAQKTFAQGYEPGSVASTFDAETRRQYQEWLKKHDSDGRIYQKQLERAYLYE